MCNLMVTQWNHFGVSSCAVKTGFGVGSGGWFLGLWKMSNEWDPFPPLCVHVTIMMSRVKCKETPDLRRCVHFFCSIVDGGNKLEVCFLLHLWFLCFGSSLARHATRCSCNPILCWSSSIAFAVKKLKHYVYRRLTPSNGGSNMRGQLGCPLFD